MASGYPATAAGPDDPRPGVPELSHHAPDRGDVRGRRRSLRGGGALTALLVLLATVSFARAARADDFDDFLSARDYYAEGEYSVAITRLQALLGRQTLERSRLLEAVRSYLGASLFLTDREEDAAREFERVLRDNPDARLDALLFAPPVVQLFERTRERLGPELARIRESRQQALLAERQRRAARRRLMLEALGRETVALQVPRWLMFVPAGVGQFANGDTGLGWFFAIAESASLAAGLTGYTLGVIGFPQRGALHTLDDARLGQYTALQALNVVGFGLFAVTSIAGILQAHLAYRPERREVRTRPVPPELRGLQLSRTAPHQIRAGAMGLSLSF